MAGGINDVATILGRRHRYSLAADAVAAEGRDVGSPIGRHLHLAAINEVVGIDLLAQSLFPVIIDLSEDSKRRVRSIIDTSPLAEQLGKAFFDEKQRIMHELAC